MSHYTNIEQSKKLRQGCRGYKDNNLKSISISNKK